MILKKSSFDSFVAVDVKHLELIRAVLNLDLWAIFVLLILFKPCHTDRWDNILDVMSDKIYVLFLLTKEKNIFYKKCFYAIKMNYIYIKNISHFSDNKPANIKWNKKY